MLCGSSEPRFRRKARQAARQKNGPASASLELRSYFDC
jgi:hypothetical protein